MPCRAVPCRAVPCRAVPCRAVPCRAVPCRAVPCRAVPFYRRSHLLLARSIADVLSHVLIVSLVHTKLVHNQTERDCNQYLHASNGMWTRKYSKRLIRSPTIFQSSNLCEQISRTHKTDFFKSKNWAMLHVYYVCLTECIRYDKLRPPTVTVRYGSIVILE